ncbi:type II toxin-antitoxin system PemK/MazF family toxin [Desulfitobacterium sp. AusDCA]|uniref:type II toxin-antitoxin system PemK/MazF family toxin n=1 Tax=Desulfitobacterium sp. AusDCA TaxID=3240383 RepID=UPI003DA79E7B
MSLPDLIRDSLIDTREFEFGQVWTVNDELVSIPDADRIDERILHNARIVLIVSNNSGNTDPLNPIVTVAPLSHRVDCIKFTDIELYAQRDNLKYDSIVRLRLAQPVLKADLIKCLGLISMDGKGEVLIGLEEYFGLLVEEE